MANINKVTTLLFPSIVNETLTVNQIAQNAYENDIENVQNNLMMNLIRNKYTNLLDILFQSEGILCLPVKTLFKKSDEALITEDYICMIFFFFFFFILFVYIYIFKLIFQQIF